LLVEMGGEVMIRRSTSSQRAENGAGGLKLIDLLTKIFTKARKTKINLGLMSEHSTSKLIVLPVNIFTKRRYRLGYGVEGFEFEGDIVTGHSTENSMLKWECILLANVFKLV
jgi:hypothetical protein